MVNLINNTKDISNKLNEFFVNVGPTTEDSIPETQNVSALKCMKERQNFKFLIAHVSQEEVLEIIKSLENKSVGPVIIPIKLIKLIPDLILFPLCNIINVSFKTGVFPSLFYRPISLLSIFDKIIEKLMHTRLYNFMKENDIL